MKYYHFVLDKDNKLTHGDSGRIEPVGCYVKVVEKKTCVWKQQVCPEGDLTCSVFPAVETRCVSELIFSTDDGFHVKGFQSNMSTGSFIRACAAAVIRVSLLTLNMCRSVLDDVHRRPCML